MDFKEKHLVGGDKLAVKRYILDELHAYGNVIDLEEDPFEEISPKVKSAEWLVEERNGDLLGKISFLLSAPLTDQELIDLKNWTIDQNSDGFGESFEQTEVPINSYCLGLPRGINCPSCLVSFYDGKETIYTERELEQLTGSSY